MITNQNKVKIEILNNDDLELIMNLDNYFDITSSGTFDPIVTLEFDVHEHTANLDNYIRILDNWMIRD